MSTGGPCAHAYMVYQQFLNGAPEYPNLSYWLPIPFSLAKPVSGDDHHHPIHATSMRHHACSPSSGRLCMSRGFKRATSTYRRESRSHYFRIDLPKADWAMSGWLNENKEGRAEGVGQAVQGRFCRRGPIRIGLLRVSCRNNPRDSSTMVHTKHCSNGGGRPVTMLFHVIPCAVPVLTPVFCLCFPCPLHVRSKRSGQGHSGSYQYTLSPSHPLTLSYSRSYILSSAL